MSVVSFALAVVFIAKLYSKILEPLRKKQQTDKVGFKRTNLKLHKTRKASILLSEARAPVAC